MSDEEKDETSEELENPFKPKTIAFNLQEMNLINTKAIDSLKLVQDQIPNFLETFKNITPKLNEDLVNSFDILKNMEITKSNLSLDLDQITEPLIQTPQLITPIQKESTIIEKQNEAITLLKKLMKDNEKRAKQQFELLNNIFKMIKELTEEQRLEHPMLDKIYKMSLEWEQEDTEGQ